MNLERAIRLLTQVVIPKTYLKTNTRPHLLALLPSLILFQGGLEVLGVGGGVRNSTGQWAVPCYQIELAYYMLSLQVQCLYTKTENFLDHIGRFNKNSAKYTGRI